MNFERERIKSSPSGYSDTFILVAGDIINIIVNAENYTDVVFNNCAPFSTCKTEINHIFIDEANYIYIAMPMYKLNEYSNYWDTSGSVWQFKRDEVPANNADSTIDSSQSFNYKAYLVGKHQIMLVQIAL